MAATVIATGKLTRNPHYRGPCTVWGIEEAHSIFCELFHYFGLDRSENVPVFDHYLSNVALSYKPSAEALEAIGSSIAYLLAGIEDRPKRQYKALEKIEDLLRAAYETGRKAASDKEEREHIHLERVLRMGIRSYGIDKRSVYFVGSDSGKIKIGVSRDPVKRLSGIQTGHPEKLSILAIAQGGGSESEREYHARFAEHRASGEWFERHPDILAEIERLSS